MSRYAVSDLHGNYNLWQQINNFIKPEDTLFVLGDCADRGPDGWAIIKEVIDMPNAYYIRGNHEQMILDRDYGLWAYNGGRDTINDYDNEIEELKTKAYNTLKETVLRVDIINDNDDIIHLTHAGFDPDNVPSQRYEKDYLWDRHHLFHEWEGKDNEYIVHGHTCIPYLKDMFRDNTEWNGEPYFYANNHKINIDCCSFITNYTILFNIDTFDYVKIGHLDTTNLYI